MTAVDLIMRLSQLPPELEVIYENTKPGDNGFRMVVVEDLDVITLEDDRRFILLNVEAIEKLSEEIGDDEI